MNGHGKSFGLQGKKVMEKNNARFSYISLSFSYKKAMIFLIDFLDFSAQIWFLFKYKSVMFTALKATSYMWMIMGSRLKSKLVLMRIRYYGIM